MTVKVVALTGGQAAAEALRQINPGVFASYPITPQTPIVETFAKFVADGKVTTEFISSESEHSSLSIVVGAAASGVRATTATSSQGLALMFEILAVASGLRLPIVMNLATRALSSPLNIHGDHSDAMAVRETGWLQIFSENPQEVYDNNLLAVKVAEDARVRLPAFVCQDGFITSHCVEGVSLLSDSEVSKFVGDYFFPFNLLDIKHPLTIGSLVLPDYYSDFKTEQMKAARQALSVFNEIGKSLTKTTKRTYPACEATELADCEYALVAMGSTAGTARAAVKKLRQFGEKVGLIKVRLFRPFPYEELGQLLHGVTAVGVLDRAPSYGAEAPLAADVKASLYGQSFVPKVKSFTYGLGGKDVQVDSIINNYWELKGGHES